MNHPQSHVSPGVLSAILRLRNLALGLLLVPALSAPAPAQTNPVQVGEVAIFAPNDVVVSGDLAFVTSGWTSGHQLNVVDVSDPTNPAILSTLPLSGRCQGVAVEGSTVFVATNIPGGIHVIDVADPAAPELVTSFGPLGGDVWDVAVSNGMAYILCDGAPGLSIVDVSDPAQPVFRSSIYPPGFNWCRWVEVDGNFAYVGYEQVYYGGFRVVDVSNPSAPFLAASVTNPLGSQGGGPCFAENGVAYQMLRIEGGKVATFDVATPSSPVYLANVVTTDSSQGKSTPWGLTARDNVLYVAGGRYLGSATLNIYDCADPAAPVFLGRLQQPYPRQFGRLAVSGSTVYVTNAPGITGGSPVGGSLVLVDSGLGHPPTADAGADFSVDEGQASVALNGSASSDPDNDPLTYAWEQVGVATVTLTGADTVAPSFDAPLVTTNTTLTFRLTVTAGGESASDTVDVTVVNINHPPVADAGDDLSVAEGTLGVALDGSDSYDDDMDALTYAWLQIGGPVVSLSSATAASPTFDAPYVGGSGAPGVVATLEFRLTVDDSFGGSATDTVSVEITNVNNLPTAVAGADQTVDENTPVSLAGSGSDPDGDALSYSWLQTSGTGVVITGADTATPSFAAPFVNPGGGDLAFQLRVSDGYGGLATDQVVVHVLNANDPPLVSAAAPTVGTLWPPTHGLVSVGITGVSDPDNNATIVITAVTQDEPTNGLGDGDTAIDAIINPDGTVLLRAERSGTGNGRVYHVHFTASDLEGSVSGVVTVSVPKTKKSVAVDDGELYDSTL